jgi:hypothetical protein
VRSRLCPAVLLGAGNGRVAAPYAAGIMSGVARDGTSQWYAAVALSGAAHAAGAAVVFAVLTPTILVGLDYWDAYLSEATSPPGADVATVMGALYIALLAGAIALVPAVLLGGALGAGNGGSRSAGPAGPGRPPSLSLSSSGRSWGHCCRESCWAVVWRPGCAS